MSKDVMQVNIKAFDEFTQAFQRLQRELKNTQREERDLKRSTDSLNRSTDQLLETLGGVGVLYAYSQGILAVAEAGRQFELSIRQAQAVTGDFTSDLRDFAIQMNEGIHGPQQMAQAFYELGSAGLNAQQTIMATPEVLDFATAGLIDLEKSAYSVISTVQAFRLEWEQAGEVTDAFTESMNATTLAAEDFQWVMSSAGAVAKMAGQDFREVLSAAAAMKDAGVQAQDAGTSIKSALLAIINPTSEARDIMDELGIEIYNSAGNMKQWHEIVAEFEEALGPYNQQSRDMIMTTILGSDGIRAMATSMNMGSETLADYVDAMADAEGATERMADMMANTFDGALKKVSGNLERAKILLFEDFSEGAVDMLEAINAIIVGFNDLDEGARRVIEMIVGAGGLIVAINLLISALSKLRTVLGGLSILAGPAGWIITGLSLLTMGAIQYADAQKEAAEAQEQANAKLAEYNRLINEGVKQNEIKSTEQEIQRIEKLIKKREELIEKRKEESGTSSAAYPGIGSDKYLDELEKVDEELASIGLTYDTAKEKLAGLNEQVRIAHALNTDAIVARTNEVIETQKSAQATEELARKYLKLTENVRNANDISKLNANQKEALSEVTQALADKYSFLITKTDEHGQALLLDRKGIQEQISVTKDMARTSMEAARSRIEQERALTREVIAETRKRIQALLAVQQAMRDSLRENTTFTRSERESRAQAAELFGIYTIAPEVERQREKLQQAEKAANTYTQALKALDNLKIMGADGGSKSFELPGTDKKGTNEALKAIRDYIDGIKEAMRPLTESTRSLSDQLSILTAQEEYFENALESGQATLAERVRLQGVWSLQMDLLSQHQEALTRENEAYNKSLQQLAKQLKAVSDQESRQKILDEMQRVRESIAKNRAAWWQDENTRASLIAKRKAREDRYYWDAYQQAMDLMRHQVSMARMSTEQQIDYLERLRSAHEWNTEQMWDLEEQLFQLRQQALDKYLGRLDDEYQDALDDIDSRTNETISKLQRQLDMMDEEEKIDQREEAARQHQEKLAELYEKRKYHELRTGKDHKKAIEDLDKDIAEEERRWRMQQEEWSREDRRRQLQEKIEDTRDAAERERDELEEHYRKAREIAESGVMDTIAALAATEPKWQETGKQLVDALIRGMESGDFSSVNEIVDRVRRAGDDAAGRAGDRRNDQIDGISDSGPEVVAAFSPSDYDNVNGTAAMLSRQLAQALGKSVQWDNGTKQVVIGGKKFSPVKMEDDKTYLSIRQVAQALGYDVDYDSRSRNITIYRSYDTGGPVWQTGPAFVHEGEYVLNKNDVSVLAAGLREFSRMRESLQDVARTQVLIYNQNGPLVYVGQVNGDRSNMQTLAEEIVGTQQQAIRGKGRWMN